MNKNRLIFLSLITVTAMVFSGCYQDTFYLFDDELWPENIEMSRSRVMRLDPEPPSNYPSVNEIKNSSVVIAQMDSAWTMMKNSCSPSGRREYGFWVYYTHSTSTYWCGEIEAGPLTGYQEGTGASISLSVPTDNLEVCAFFHTHTSLHYATSGSRVTGPSPGDLSTANSYKAPGLLYDYSAYSISAGHSLEDDYQLYTFGPDSRIL